MNITKIKYNLRLLTPVFIAIFLVGSSFNVSEMAAKKTSVSKRSSKGKGVKKGATKGARTKKGVKKTGGGGVQVLLNDTATGEWIHKGNRGIIIHKDTAGTVRAMTVYSGGKNKGRHYAEAINRYAEDLANDNVNIYMMIAPSQGEYYLPDGYGEKGAQQEAIETTADYLDVRVIPVFADDSLRMHVDEEIYNRTDHHWAPLGAYYAASCLAKEAGVDFLSLSAYKTGVVKDYVGTMVKFSGDNSIKNYPEEFVYYMPPEGYKSEFITYKKNGETIIEQGPMHEESFFRHFPDGSGAAYSTFMGGDSRTVKVSQTGGTPGRRLLIVKDSYGNAVAPCLIKSFEELHVIDFRYFPHNLLDYIRDNGITDLAFINTIGLAFATNTSNRLDIMRTKGRTKAENSTPIEEEEDDNDDNNDSWL